MAVEYLGEEFLYLVEVPGEDGDPTANYRLFNQTGGSTSEESDSIDLSTKDKSGSDYGNSTHTISVEGILTHGDIAIDYIKKARRRKEFVKIIEVNTRTNNTETGMYMVSSFERSYPNSEHATYTIEAALNGSLTEGTLSEIPNGAPDAANDGGDNGGENGGDNGGVDEGTE